MKYIDLFAGAGGLSEGFCRNGFESVAHVEMDKNSCFSLKTRISYYYLKENNKIDKYNEYLKGKIIREDLYREIPDKYINSVICSEISKNTINDIFKLIDDKLNGDKLSLIIGGPPCQAYSVVGRARDPNNMKNDSRNYLYRFYARFLKKYKPEMFVFENVPGLLNANNGSYLKKMRAYFRTNGYKTQYKTLNASDFGVIQNRKRVIIIGWKEEKKYSYPEFDNFRSNLTVKDLFADLPVIQQGNNINLLKYRKNLKNSLNYLNIRNGNDFVTQHITRSHCERDLKIYKIVVEKWLNCGERLKYTDLPDHLITHKNLNSFLDRFKVIDPNGYSHTVVAHLSKDGHHFIYPDLNTVRSISVREAARIQSFPDDYYFEGGKTNAFKQIGNAVPPVMAKVIAKKIKKKLNIYE